MMEIMSISNQKKERKSMIRKVGARVQLYGREFHCIHLMRVEELLLTNSVYNFLMGA
jgi:hypothetical protein